MTTIAEGQRKAVVLSDVATAAYTPVSQLVDGLAVPAAASPAQHVQIVVETLGNSGPVLPRALLGADFTPAATGTIALTVNVGGPLGVGQPATCASALGRPLVPGLPPEFAQAVLAELKQAAVQLGPGTLIIGRAGYDEVNSSAMAFRRTVRVLVEAIAALSQGRDPEPGIRTALRAR